MLKSITATLPWCFQSGSPCSVEILNEGDEAGQGLVRTCVFGIPRYLMSGGTARSWEVVSEAGYIETLVLVHTIVADGELTDNRTGGLVRGPRPITAA